MNHSTALSAGLRLIPFTVASPFGSAISATIAGKLKVPPIYMVICASCLQIVGFALLSSLSLSTKETNAQYGYQVITGFGVGINISTLIIMAPFSIREKRDLCRYSLFRYPDLTANQLLQLSLLDPSLSSESWVVS